MARLDRLHNLPTEPGDTVRDRKTKTDYVVQNVSILAGGGASLYYLLRAADGKLEEFRGANLEETGFYTVRKNVEKYTPEQVRTNRIDFIRKTLKGNEELARKLEGSEFSVFRDLILLMQDASDETVASEIRALADALVGATGQTFSKAEVLEIAKRSLGPSADFLGEESLENLAEEVSQATSRATNVADRLGRPNAGAAKAAIELFGRDADGNLNYLERALGIDAANRRGRGARARFEPGALSTQRGVRDSMYQSVFRERGAIPTSTQRVAGLGALLEEEHAPQRKVAKLLSQVTRQDPDGHLIRMLSKNVASPGSRFDYLRDALIDANPGGTSARLFRATPSDKALSIAFRQRNNRRAANARLKNRRKPRAVDVRGFINRQADQDRVVGVSVQSLVEDLVSTGKVRVKAKGAILEGTLRDKGVAAAVRGALGDKTALYADASVWKAALDGGVLDVDAVVGADAALRTSADFSRASLEGAPMASFERMAATQASRNEGAMWVTQAEGGPVFSKSYEDAARLEGKLGYINLEMGEQLGSFDFTDQIGLAERFKDRPMQTVARTPVVALSTAKETALATYQLGKRESTIAYVLLKKGGKEERRLVGSNGPVPLQEQLDRGLRAAKSPGRAHVRLDIESSKDSVGRLALSYGDTADGILASLEPSGRHASIHSRRLKEVDALIRTAGYLADDATETVGTHSEHDLPTLSKRAANLAALLERDSMYLGDEASAPAMAEALRKASGQFDEAFASKWYDTIGLFTAAGHHEGEAIKLGSASQGELTHRVLDAGQSHNPWVDNVQNEALGRALGIADAESIVVDGKAPQYFQVVDTRLGEHGSLLRLLGFEQQAEGPAAVFEHVTGGYSGVGGYVDMPASSVSQLGAAFQGLAEVADPDSTEVRAFADGAAHDSALRDLRRMLNPFESTYGDPTYTHTPQSGVFGLHDLAATREARRLLREKGEDGIRQMLEERTMAGNVAVQGGDPETLFSRVADRLLDGITKLDTLDEDIDPSVVETQNVFRSRVKSRLIQALESGQGRSILEKLDFVDSAAGRQLSQMVEAGLAGSTVHRVAATTLAAQLMDAAPLTQAAAPARSRVSFRLVDDPRPLKTAVSTKYGRRTAAASMRDSVREMIGQAILSSDVEGASRSAVEEAIGEALPENLIQAISEYKTGAGASQGTDKFSKAAREVYLLDRHEGSGAKLKNLQTRLDNTDYVRDRVKQQLIDQASSHGEFADTYRGIVDDVFSDRRQSASQAVEKVFLKTRSAYGERAHELFAPTPGMVKDVIGLSSMGEDEAAALAREHLARAEQFLDPESMTGGMNTFDEIASLAADYKRATLKAGVDEDEAWRMTNMFMQEAQQAVLNSPSDTNPLKAVHQIATSYMGALSPTSDTVMRAQARLSNQAASAGVGAAADAAGVAAHHAAALGLKPTQVGKYAKVAVPLLAVGGVLALMGASVAPQEDYKAGQISMQTPGRIPSLSEIPGSANPRVTFHGQMEPFQVTLDISGFVRDRREKQAIQQRVYDVVSGKVRTARVSKEERDTTTPENKSKARMAIDDLRRAI